jgi:DnaK suppressor protein
MDKNTLDHFKTLFLNFKANALEGDLENALLLKTSGDDIEQATLVRDRGLALKLQGRQNFFLKKIEKAMSKIDKGTFGECEDCGSDISISRLQARPTATLCISCKEIEEKGEGQLLYEKRSHTLGKEIINNNVISVQFGESEKKRIEKNESKII